MSGMGSLVGTITARNGTGMFGPVWEQRCVLGNLLRLLAHLWSSLMLTRPTKGWSAFSGRLSRAKPSSQQNSRKSCLMSLLMAQRSPIVLNGTVFLLVWPSLACLVWPLAFVFVIPRVRIHDCWSTVWLCYILHSFFKLLSHGWLNWVSYSLQLNSNCRKTHSEDQRTCV